MTLMAPFKEKLLENALVELTLLLLCVTNVSQVLWVKIVNIACLVTFLIVQMVVANHVVVIPLAPTLLTIVIQLMVNVSARKGLKGYNVIIVLEVKLEINVTNAQMTIPEKVLLEIAFQVAVPNLAHGKELTMELVFVKKKFAGRQCYACSSRYTGNFCDRCNEGYFQDPDDPDHPYECQGQILLINTYL